MSQRIAVIDYGMGNLHSVASALHAVAPQDEVIVTADAEVVASADRVILPGVGAIRDCMGEILRLGVDRSVAQVIDSGRPLLAICVGLQALMQHSEENGGVSCLGYFKGSVHAFSGLQGFFVGAGDDSNAPSADLKVPHMGWNTVQQALDHPLWRDIPDNSRFYFVHSYCVPADQIATATGLCRYGVDFCAALAQDNVFATQFHPEKSHRHGLQLLKNFVAWQTQ